MNTTTLRGIFPEPKPIHRKNFVRENIKHLKEMQGYMQESKIASQSQEIKPNKFKNIAPRVYSNVNTLRKFSKDSIAKRPVSYVAHIPKGMKTQIYNKNKYEIVHRGVQTERPEDIAKLYETGVLKYPRSSVTATVKQSSNKASDQGDHAGDKLTKNLQKLDLEERQNHIKQNIKNVKAKVKRDEEVSDPTLPPATYQRGVLPKYLKDRKEPDLKPIEFEGENLTGLVLLPDDERKEYLRVARENYAALIKELNSMPVSNDTLKKRKRKMEIEDELKRLDEVIKIFQKPKVFVKADV